MLDKGRKKFRALSNIRGQPTPFVMLADADDLIHRELVKTVADNPSPSGWFVKTGYFYYEKGWPFLVRSSDFDNSCGTSIIARVDCNELPIGDLEWLERPSEDGTHFLMRPHQEIRSHLSSRGIEMKEFPFPAVISVRGTMENVVNPIFPRQGLRSYFGLLRRSKRLTKRIRGDFGLQELDYDRVRWPLPASWRDETGHLPNQVR